MASGSNQGSESVSSLSEGIARCSVSCPMCGHRHIQYRVNPQLYWFTDMDVDRRPTGYHCRKSLEGYYPRLYEIWHCPQCHFTAHNRVFPDPLKHVYIEKGLVARRLADLRKADPAMGRITETLAKGLAIETMDFPQAIRLSLLDVFYQKLMYGVLNQGEEDLAWGCLRLAWLFRDWQEQQPDRAEGEQRLNEALEEVVRDWPECPRSESAAMEAACTWFGRALDRTSKDPNPVDVCGMMVQIARIRVKMGAVDAALSQLGECHRSIVLDLETLTREMNEDMRTGQLSDEERGRMLSDSRKLRSMLDECRALKESIQQGKAAEDRQRAEEVIRRHAKSSPAELRNRLEEAGISDALIRKLVPERKESLFGGFFKS